MADAMSPETVSPARGAKRRQAPGPPGVPLFGSFFELRRLGQVGFLTDLWRRYGDLFRFKVGPFINHIVTHPDHLRQVLMTNRKAYEKGLGYVRTQDLLGLGLLTSEGDLWQRQRRLMQPPFTHKGIAGYAADMVAAAEAMLGRWQPLLERGEPLELHREMHRLTITIIGRTMLGMDLDAGGREVELVEAYGAACEVINERLQSIVDVPLAVPTPGNLRIRRAVGLLDERVQALVEERRRTGPRPDLLSKLLDARDEETGEGMSPKQIRDEIVTLFFAGHETSAVALTWAWYLLSQHPEVERKLHEELDAVLGARAATVEDLPRLRYTRMVVDETLRLYPPVWIFPRQAAASDELGGFHIPKGSLVFPCQYLTHRNPAFWPEPDAFRPERFDPDVPSERPLLAYLPFGAGPRTCIGNHFALMELCLVLATVARRVRPRLVPGHPVEPTSIITLQPAHGMRMTLAPR